MKKTLLISLLCLMAGLSGKAQDRIFILTDRSTYIAGDLVFCSVYALDQEGRNEDFSTVSYLELISADGTLTEAKIGLFNGRGAGSFRIPANAPTGNYRLLGYTARSSASLECTSVLTVFNTTSTARVNGGVAFASASEYKPAQRQNLDKQGNLRLSFPVHVQQGHQATLVIEGMDQDADLVVSVYHEDDLPSCTPVSLQDFLQGAKAEPGNRSGEYEGEVIYASVEGLADTGSADDSPEHVTAFLSTAGSLGNIYVGKPAGDGLVRFYTGSIYGDRELVCEVVSMYGKSCHISLKSPFTRPDPGQLPVLQLNAAQRGDLVSRKASLKECTQQPLDTLVQFMPKREDLLLEGLRYKRYHLDDYTRFPTIQEICTEFIPELKFGRTGSQWRLRLNATDATSSRRYLLDNILVLMDGVVITNHGMLADFDAMLLEDIDIYSEPIAMGSLSFNGVVNFVSKKNYVTALSFPSNTQVIDYKGVSYPVAYLGAAPAGRDLRQLLYWNPCLQLKNYQNQRVQIKAPDYSGKFRIVVQGRKADGSVLYTEHLFQVE